MIGALGHGKEIIDGINTCDKRYSKSKICMVGTSEANNCNNRVLSHSMIGNAHYSFAEEFKRLCGISGRENGTKGHSKYKKHESKSKLKKQFYYVQT